MGDEASKVLSGGVEWRGRHFDPREAARASRASVVRWRERGHSIASIVRLATRRGQFAAINQHAPEPNVPPSDFFN
jgi:hypothetical protein